MNEQRRKYGSEFLGTFALVLVGAGAVIVESHTGMSHLGKPEGKVGLTGIALAHGGILAAMICAVGSVSGGHFNPAVSLAAWLRQRLDGSLLLGYMAAQIAGAVVAAVCLAGLFPDEIALAGLGTPNLADKISVAKGIAFEALITFVLTMVILLVTRDDNEHAGVLASVAIGATLTSLIFVAGPLTGAAANPARYLGPAIVAGRLQEILVYLAGPFAGGGFAALVCGFMERHALGEPTPPGGGGDEDEPGPGSEPSGDFPGTLYGRRDGFAVLARAHELLDAGNGEGAAAVVLPVLIRAREYDGGTVERARALLRRIEQECGELELLKEHHSLLDASPPSGVSVPPAPGA